MSSSTLRATLLSAAAGGALAVLGILFGPAGSASADTVDVHLDATTGTTLLPVKAGTQSVKVFGYCRRADAATPCGTVTAPGGPTVRVTAGDIVTITLHNTIPGETTSLLLGGQAIAPDRTGAPTGGTRTYTFTASRPGTYLYEAGLTPNSQHQVAMGLYGALVVAPATAGQAYDATTPYDTDAVLVTSEVDPLLNNAADPRLFDMRGFTPRWTLVNGRPAPDAAHVSVPSGQTVLLRWVNAGVGYHSMAVLGAEQHVVGLDGSQLRNGAVDTSRHLVADTFGPGQTVDALVTVPATVANRRLAVYDASLTLHNHTAAGTGGMLTFLDVVGTGVAGADTAGPSTTGVAWAASALTATVSDAATGGGTVAAAEYRVDSVTAAATAMGGTFGGPSATVSATVPVPSGQHVLYVRGQDGAGNWGPWSSVLVTGADTVGPTTSGLSLTPDRTNGTVAVAVEATGDDSASGNSAVTAGQWAIDGGTPTAMTVTTPAPVVATTGSIPAATVLGLSQGTHQVAVRTRDAAGNWGDWSQTALVVDRTAPTTSGASVTPNPNNGTLPVNGSSPAVRLSATVTDPAAGDGTALSTVVRAEARIDGGTAIPMEAADGAWSGSTENVYLDIPLTTVRLMTDGNHTITVRGMDAAGNWGATTSTTLTVDKAGPTFTGLALSPNPTIAATTVTLTGTAVDGSGVSRVEWFIGTDPGVGQATTATIGANGSFTATIPVGTFADGDYTVQVRGVDTLGNRSAATASVVLHVTPRLWFSTLGNTAPPGVTGTADDADIYGAWSANPLFRRSIDATAAPYRLPNAVNVDGFSRVDATRFYLSFSGSVALPGIGVVVQDEDVVYWNGSAWSLFFDGSTRGLSATDVDAISVVGGTLYFSTDSTTVPTGVSGAGDAADIYRWTGTAMSRVIDASTVGIPSTANVDGFVWRSATDWLMSFSNDTDVTVGGVTAQDEDVVRRTGTTWSTYYDGTAAGLTAANQDIDAFDIP